MKGEAEKTTLIVAWHECDKTTGEIEEWRREDLAVLQDKNLASLVHDEHPAGPVVRGNEVNRRR